MERASDSLSGWVRRAGPSLPVERYLAELDAVLEGQADTSLAVDGIDAPLIGVARAVIVESIGADLEAAARDLMLAGVPRSQAEMRAISDLGPAPDLGRALLGARRRQTVMDGATPASLIAGGGNRGGRTRSGPRRDHCHRCRAPVRRDRRDAGSGPHGRTGLGGRSGCATNGAW